jgi:hypothetical protein
LRWRQRQLGTDADAYTNTYANTNTDANANAYTNANAHPGDSRWRRADRLEAGVVR